jgi:DNA-directed RNA polymerase subunit F
MDEKETPKVVHTVIRSPQVGNPELSLMIALDEAVAYFEQCESVEPEEIRRAVNWLAARWGQDDG